MPEHLSTLGVDASRDELLAALVPPAALTELQELQRDGIAASRGVTDDRAYDNPVAIRDTFLRLHGAGQRYQADVGSIRAATATGTAPGLVDTRG